MTFVDPPFLPDIKYIQQKITGVHPAIQRSVLFAEWIHSFSPEDAALLFSFICVQPSIRKQPTDIVLAEAAFGSLLHGYWQEEHQQHTREAAAFDENAITLAFLIFPKKIDASEESFLIPKYTPERVLSLGERKSVASMPSRRKIEMALMDPHPDVAKKLLDNPKLTEADVVRISAKSSMAPSVLCEIAAHSKWRKQPIIKKALVNNRLLPADFSLTLLPFLNSHSIKEVSIDQRLHESVRHAAGLLVAAFTPKKQEQ